MQVHINTSKYVTCNFTAVYLPDLRGERGGEGVRRERRTYPFIKHPDPEDPTAITLVKRRRPYPFGKLSNLRKM
jgi:hypothetical protein